MVALLQKRRKAKKPAEIGPECNGTVMTPEQFDRSEFEDGWRYELINGVLIVSPIPAIQERDPNDELGRLLRNYGATHPQGKALNRTVYEHIVVTGRNRRKPDRVIWAGLPKLPRSQELPTIVVEFVSKRRRDRLLDYKTKRDEFMAAGIKEYWVIDRFQRTLTAFTKSHGKVRKKVVQANQTHRTDLLPGFELRPGDLFQMAADWPESAGDNPIDN